MEKKKPTALEMQAFLKIYFSLQVIEAYKEMLKSQALIHKLADSPIDVRCKDREGLLIFTDSLLRLMQCFNMDDFNVAYTNAISPEAMSGFGQYFLTGLDYKESTPSLFDSLLAGASYNHYILCMSYILRKLNIVFEVGEAGWEIHKNGNLALYMHFNEEENEIYGDSVIFLEHAMKECFGRPLGSLNSWPTEEEIDKINFQNILKKIEENIIS